MHELNVSEMRHVEGGWMLAVARASAYARYYYEHRTSGRHYTNYGFLGIRCPVCGKP